MAEDDRERVVAITSQAFNIPKAVREYAQTIPAADIRVAEDGGRVMASLRLRRVAQFYGGRSVPALGIGAVAVDPEARGRRVAETLMVEVLRELRSEMPISILYPATVPLYRRCGYEYAAPWTDYKAPLDRLPRASTLECSRWDDDALDEIAACYREAACAANGPLDRPRGWWSDSVFRVFEDEIHRFCVREDGRVTGYVVYTQQKRKLKDWGYDLICRDLVWTTPGAARGLLAFLGRHRSLGEHAVWHGAPVDSLAWLLEEQDAGIDRSFLSMTRLVDVPAAFEARGYPPHVRAAVELDVRDEPIGENSGSWRIEVADGSAKVVPAGPAGNAVGVGALAAMWTGVLSASDAVRGGWLSADADAVASLAAMFAGPPAWMSDWF
jgi:predicted acetyltransferase